MTGAHLDIIDPGLFSTLQDAGRFGFQRFGISNSGAMDVAAMRIANALVANAPGEGVIEMTLTGIRFRVGAGPCRIAVAGAGMTIVINGRVVDDLRAHDLTSGDEVAIGRAATGMRAYLAVAGGFDVAPVLGSVSTHSRSLIGGLDGGPLKAGAILPLRAGGQVPAGPPLRVDGALIPAPRRAIRVVLGPQDNAFSAAGIETFLNSAYRLSNRADRMGCQLEGPPIAHAGGFNIVSDAIANGSIQVPGHGLPVILLADRQTTGGYPKIATVIGPDLGHVAQLRPGDELTFEAVSVENAAQAARQWAEALDALVAAMEPVSNAPVRLTSRRLLTFNLTGGVVPAPAASAENGPS